MPYHVRSQFNQRPIRQRQSRQSYSKIQTDSNTFVKRSKKSYKQPSSYAQMALQGYNLATKLAAMVNTETKRWSYGLISSAPDWTGSIYTLNAVPQGDTDASRDGDSLKVQKLEIAGHLNIHASASSTIVRMILFWDKANDISSVTQFWDNTSTAYAVDSTKLWDNRFDTRVLWDYKFTMDLTNPVAIVKQVQNVGLHTQFSAGSTTINTGALKLMIISDQQTNTPSINLVPYIYYTDN